MKPDGGAMTATIRGWSLIALVAGGGLASPPAQAEWFRWGFFLGAAPSGSVAAADCGRLSDSEYTFTVNTFTRLPSTDGVEVFIGTVNGKRTLTLAFEDLTQCYHWHNMTQLYSREWLTLSGYAPVYSPPQASEVDTLAGVRIWDPLPLSGVTRDSMGVFYQEANVAGVDGILSITPCGAVVHQIGFMTGWALQPEHHYTKKSPQPSVEADLTLEKIRLGLVNEGWKTSSPTHEQVGSPMPGGTSTEIWAVKGSLRRLLVSWCSSDGSQCLVNLKLSAPSTCSIGL